MNNPINMKFELNEEQTNLLMGWQLGIKEQYGEYGIYEYKFTPLGVGCYIEVYSKISNKTLVLSNEENW